MRFSSDGGAHALNRAQPSYRGAQPFQAGHGVTCRGVYDFSNLTNSRFAIPLGQSGNMLSPYARNFVDRRQRLNYLEIPGSRAEAARNGAGTVTLSPSGR